MKDPNDDCESVESEISEKDLFESSSDDENDLDEGNKSSVKSSAAGIK